MKLVVGLGNPGPRYAATRHNMGFRIAELFAARCGVALAQACFSGRFGRGRLGGCEFGVFLPETFMNRSGEAVAAALAALEDVDPSRDLVLVYDDLDLPLGRIRLRPGGGAGGHRGIRDVIEVLGARDLPRLRFGIGRPRQGEDPVAFVLSAFSPQEEEILPERLASAADALACFVREGLGPAMSRFNRDPDAEAG